MPNVMAALLNIGGALCSTPQILADAQYYTVFQKTTTCFLVITSANINRFSKFFHWQIPKKTV